MSPLQPALFLGHGTPMNALDDNIYTRAWHRLGDSMPRPKTILVISAHWYIPATQVTAMDVPKTIHDFYGFPQPLFDFQYPAPGAPELAAQLQDLLADVPVTANQDWGLDHGAWGVLCHLYPEADIPVLQLSIDSSQPAEFHYGLGRQLAELRNQGVLILGTGNIVHNLGKFVRGVPGTPAFDWATRFDGAIRKAIESGDHDILIHYDNLGEDARLSVPSAEHYLPLLYIMALQEIGETISFPTEGIDGGSISMLSVKLG